MRVSWKAEEPNSEEVDSSGESPRVRPLFSRQGWLRSSCILPCQLMRACQVIPEPGAGKPSSLWTLGGGGSQVCLRLSALSAVWWSGNGEQRIRNFLVDHFQSVCLHTPTLVCPHCTGFSCTSLLWLWAGGLGRRSKGGRTLGIVHGCRVKRGLGEGPGTDRQCLAIESGLTSPSSPSAAFRA